jgi:hypothetical protein
MRWILSVAFSVAFVGLAVLAILTLFRGLRRAMIVSPGQYVPIPQVNPPAPVTPSAWVEIVGYTSIVWAVMHWVLIALAIVGRVVVFTIPITATVTSYVLVAAAITGVGGVMLIRRIAYGRRMISWGLVLLGILAFLGFALSLILRTWEDAPLISRQLATPMAVVLALHTLADTVIGAAAQRVGAGQPPGEAPAGM